MAYDWEHLKMLLISSQEGNQTSYKEFLTIIYPFVILRVGAKVFNGDDVEDVAQEALVGIHKSLATYDGQRALQPWVYAIIDRKVVDYIRKNGKRIKSETPFEDVFVTNSELQANIVSDAHEALKCLPDKFRKPIELTKIEGFSTKESANFLGIKENALRTRISRGLAKLKKSLED